MPKCRPVIEDDHFLSAADALAESIQRNSTADSMPIVPVTIGTIHIMAERGVRLELRVELKGKTRISS